MSTTYDPLSAAFTVDATINSVNYIVTSFSRPGKTAIGPDFTTSAGAYRGARRVKGPEDATMTIEIENAAQPIPTQFQTLTYDSSNWVIFQEAKAIGNTSAGTFNLSLRCTDIPGTISTLTLVSGGTGYTTGALIFTGGGGTGAAGTFIASAGVITSVTLTAAGSGYTSAPTVSAASGSGLSVTATIA